MAEYMKLNISLVINLMADNLSLTLIDIRILECHELLSTHIATLNKKSLKNIASYLSDEILRLPCHFK